MTDISLSQGKSVYAEDISVLDAGTNVVGQSCVVWAITITNEGTGDSVVSIADGLIYSSENRKEKVVLTDEIKTIQLVYPKGKYFDTGVSVTSNKTSVDVSVTYD